MALLRFQLFLKNEFINNLTMLKIYDSNYRVDGEKG